MKLSKTWKTVIGILTVLQLFVGLFYVLWFFTVLLPLLIAGDQQALETMFLESIGSFLLSVVLMIMLSFGTLVFYIVHAASNPHIGSGMKVFWVLLLLFFGSIVEVAYFFMEVIPEKSMTARIEEED